ncbi:MAG: hypothetical protein AAF191_17105 [Verrucomicrobiota bacterium]
MNPRSFAVLACFALFPSFSPAQELSPDQIEKILSELERVEEEIDGAHLAGRKSAVDAFRSAAGSDKAAYEFYLACIKELDFDRQGKSFIDFRNWRDRNEGRLKRPSKMLSMRLQLQYLVLTIRAAQAEERESLIPDLEAFVASYVGQVEHLEGDRGALQKQSVLDTPFAKLYELNKTIKVGESWAAAAGNHKEIYEQAVLPYYRAEGPEGLAAVWDRRIKIDTQLAALTTKDNPVAQERFQKETLPGLSWARAKDLFQFVSQTEGGMAMVRLLQSHSTHPKAKDWVGEFRGLLKGETLDTPSI